MYSNNKINLTTNSNFNEESNIESLQDLILNLQQMQQRKVIDIFKRGNKIRIKKENRGKFTEYCGGKVTQECISRGKRSPDPKIRKRATFADNARHFKH